MSECIGFRFIHTKGCSEVVCINLEKVSIDIVNDVDNSNPVVQAEQLNQIHYLVNWGSIVMGDKDANFDGIRVDAVDNVDADLLQVYTNYFRAAFGLDKSEANALAHISILEAWDFNEDPDP